MVVVVIVTRSQCRHATMLVVVIVARCVDEHSVVKVKEASDQFFYLEARPHIRF